MTEAEFPQLDELEEVKARTFTKRVALTTAIFAVLLAITSLGGNNTMKEMLLSQQQASDQWAFYQSKALREHLYKTNGRRIEMDLVERGARMSPEARKLYGAMRKDMRAEETRYGEEKRQIEEEAKHLEAERDRNLRKDPYFDFAEVLLQISIVMASISILAVSRRIFYFAIVSASLGTILMLNGYLLVFKLPFFR